MKALMCPNCQGKIVVEEGRERVFCSFCGGEILLRDLLDIRKEEQEPEKVIYMKKLENGDGFLRMNDYYRAEMIYVELINEFPNYASAYERMIRSCTRDYTVFRIENKERVLAYLSKIKEVATPEEVSDYAQVEKIIETAVWQESVRSADALEIPEINIENTRRDIIFISAISSAVLAFCAAVFMKNISQGGADPLSGTMCDFLFGLAAISAGFGVFYKKMNK